MGCLTVGKKLLVCDLDGTLLNSEERITAYTQDVLLRAKRAGMLICFASGRNEQLMNVYCSQIGNCDYIISDNGALVRVDLVVRSSGICYASAYKRSHNEPSVSQ